MGGLGNDTFIFRQEDGTDGNVIIDFDNGDNKIDLKEFENIHSLENLTYFLSGEDGVHDLTLHGGGLIILKDYTESLSTSDFIFSELMV